eukprot:m.187948 g.187948  ORF g.187948 m.187948 type:complete len:81 (+) comp14786_c1_seq1:818-1060(+)
MYETSSNVSLSISICFPLFACALHFFILCFGCAALASFYLVKFLVCALRLSNPMVLKPVAFAPFHSFSSTNACVLFPFCF